MNIAQKWNKIGTKIRTNIFIFLYRFFRRRLPPTLTQNGTKMIRKNWENLIWGVWGQPYGDQRPPRAPKKPPEASNWLPRQPQSSKNRLASRTSKMKPNTCPKRAKWRINHPQTSHNVTHVTSRAAAPNKLTNQQNHKTIQQYLSLIHI